MNPFTSLTLAALLLAPLDALHAADEGTVREGTVRGTFWVATWAMWSASDPDWRRLAHSRSWPGNEGLLNWATGLGVQTSF